MRSGACLQRSAGPGFELPRAPLLSLTSLLDWASAYTKRTSTICSDSRFRRFVAKKHPKAVNHGNPPMSESTFEKEVQKGERFKFGENWRGFLATLTDERIEAAKKSFVEVLGVDDLNDFTFLDIGSGSGLSSLVARNLGAKVCSFDFDPASVACTSELQSKYFPNDTSWTIQEGSILDRDFASSLGSFDIVYSWGVLHHTGDMWRALETAASLVNSGGILFIAIYNDQGIKSVLWRKIKVAYCSGWIGKAAITSVFYPIFFTTAFLASVLRRRNVFSEYRNGRGMSITHDWSDWLGGLPFEVARVDELFHFGRARGFVLENIVTNNGHGTNQLVFRKQSGS